MTGFSLVINVAIGTLYLKIEKIKFARAITYPFLIKNKDFLLDMNKKSRFCPHLNWVRNALRDP